MWTARVRRLSSKALQNTPDPIWLSLWPSPLPIESSLSALPSVYIIKLAHTHAGGNLVLLVQYCCSPVWPCHGQGRIRGSWATLEIAFGGWNSCGEW